MSLLLVSTLAAAAFALPERAEDPRPRSRDDAKERLEGGLDAPKPLVVAQDATRSTPASSPALDGAAERAIERGLAWLAARADESPDGSLPATGISERDDRGFAS